MGVLPDWMIQRDVKIEPFADGQHRPGVISYGVTSYGYDVRVDRHFKVFTNVWGSTVDPKQFDPKSFVDVEGDCCIIPPNSFALAETVEYLEIPRDILVRLRRQIDVRRCGIIVNVTPLEPEWRGQDYHRDQQHHAAASQDLRRRGHRANPLPQGAKPSARRATPTRRASTRIRPV